MKYNKTKSGTILRKVFLGGTSWDVGIAKKSIFTFDRHSYKLKYSILRVWKRCYYREKDWGGVPDEM